MDQQIMLEIIGVIIAVIGILSLVGGAVVIFRSAAYKETLKTWQESAAAYKDKSERLEETVAELTATLEQVIRRVEHLENENNTLRALHDSRADFTALRDLIVPALAGISASLTTLANHQGVNVGASR